MCETIISRKGGPLSGSPGGYAELSFYKARGLGQNFAPGQLRTPPVQTLASGAGSFGGS